MFGRLVPKEVRYFDYFDAHAEQIVRGGEALVGLINAMLDAPEKAESFASAIDTCEREADRITHDTEAMLHRSFITPFDRDEIHQLINNMDNILDQIQDVAESVFLYDVHQLTPATRTLAELSLACCKGVNSAVTLLRSMNNAPSILKHCHQIDESEAQADIVLREAMSKLFREEQDIRQLIKLKVIYEQLEAVTDRCKDVSTTVEGIVLENS